MQGKKTSISKEQVLSAIRKLAEDLGQTPTAQEL